MRLEIFRRVPLGRLSPREVVELLKDALKSESLAEKLGGKVAHKSDGVPFIIFEILRGLRDGQFITELPDGTWVETKVVEEIEIPSAVRDLVEVRLSDLSEQQRQILDAASVVGYEFDPGLVARALGLERILVLQQLAAIARGVGLVCGEGRKLRFDHHLVQEILYANLLDGLREEYHAAIGLAIEVRENAPEREPGDLPGSLAVELTRHLLLGRRGEGARRYLDQACDQLIRDGAASRLLEITGVALGEPGLFEGEDRADLLLRRAKALGLAARFEEELSAARDGLDLGVRHDARRVVAEAHLEMGRALHRTSRFSEAEGAFREAVGSARRAGDRKCEARALGALGHALNNLGNPDEARRSYREALSAFREIGDQVGEAMSRSNIAMALHRCASASHAEDLLRSALDTARGVGDLPFEASVAQNLAVVLGSLGRMEEAVDLAREALNVHQEAGNRWGEAGCSGTLGGLLAATGDWEGAAGAYGRQLQLAREVSDRQMEAMATGDLGVQCMQRGRSADAIAHLEQALVLFSELGSRGLMAWAETNLGAVRRDLGDLTGAELHLERGVELATDLGDEIELGYALMGLARISDYRGDARRAERRYGDALEIRRGMNHSGPVAATLLAVGSLLRRSGDLERASKALLEAGDLAREAGSSHVEALAALELALIEGEVRKALPVVSASKAKLSPLQSIATHQLLWQVTRDRAHLEKAHRILSRLRDYAPEEYRDTMIANVPLHRDIMVAWREHQAAS
jgi:tetratricopeptide (TPR) repeat protein